MADTNKGAALLLNDAGNIDRARTTDGSIFRIESTLSMEAAEEAKTAAANCNTATESAEAAEKTRVSNENARKTAETERGNNETTRKNNETSRKNAETTRQDNETARKNAETTRQNNETSRSNAEIERKKAESQRHDEHIADQRDLCGERRGFACGRSGEPGVADRQLRGARQRRKLGRRGAACPEREARNAFGELDRSVHIHGQNSLLPGFKGIGERGDRNVRLNMLRKRQYHHIDLRRKRNGSS